MVQGMKSLILPLTLLVILTSCGGGSSSQSPSVASNQSPKFTSISQIEFVENTQGIAHTIQATDADNDLLTYSISGADADLFSLSENGQQLSFKQTPDFESPMDSDKDNNYVIQAKVEDGKGGSASQNITLAVTNLNQLEIKTTFPLPNSHSLDELTEIMVSGSIVDLEDNIVDINYADTFTVNGVAPVINDSLLNQWSAKIPLILGTNDIRLETQDSNASTQYFENAVIRDIGHYALDSANNRAFLIDHLNDVVVSLDLDTGEQRNVAKYKHLVEQMLWDESNSRLLLISRSRDPLIPSVPVIHSLDVETAEILKLSEPSKWTNGTELDIPYSGGFSLYNNGNKLVSVRHNSHHSFQIVNLTTGLISAVPYDLSALENSYRALPSTGIGIHQLTAKGLVAGRGFQNNQSGGQFYWLDFTTGLLEYASPLCSEEDFQVNTAQIFYDETTNQAYTGENFNTLNITDLSSCGTLPVEQALGAYNRRGIEIDVNNKLVLNKYSDNSLTVFDLENATKEVVFAEKSIGENSIIPLTKPVITNDGQSLIGLSYINEEQYPYAAVSNLSSIELHSGKVSLISSIEDENGPQIAYPQNIVFNETQTIAYLASEYNKTEVINEDNFSFYSVNLETNQRSLIYRFDENNVKTIKIHNIIDMVFNSDKEELYVLAVQSNEYSLEDNPLSLIAINVLSGEARIIADQNIGSGVGLGSYSENAIRYDGLNIAFDAETNHILLVKYVPTDVQLVGVNPETGYGTLISASSHGEGPALTEKSKVFIDEKNSRYILSSFTNTIAINKSTGERALINEATIRISAFDSDRQVGYIFASNSLMAIDIATTDMAIISKN